MKALVTGASGFVGFKLVQQLLSRANQVQCLVRSESAAAPLGALGAACVLGDVGDISTLKTAVCSADVVFHLAGIRRSSSREEFFRVNAEGTKNICEAVIATRKERTRLVLCGSLAAMGPSTPTHPLTEDAPFSPREPYGASKAEAERIAFSYGNALEVTVARPPRILGPGDRENLTFFRLVARGYKLKLTGPERPLSVIDVDDVVEGLLTLAHHPAAVNQAFFLTSPETTSLHALQDLVESLLGSRARKLTLSPAMLHTLATMCDGFSSISGRRLPLNRKLARQLLAPAWTCSPDKASRLLGFSTRQSIDASIRRSAVWYREQKLL